ncbi:ECF transporter S component [Streptococcus macacae]|uniref:Membrane protein n=1 Tax=Streptococcus macacae NCTC 11558 TaxID=764298 RepID=G5JUC7_9STRE|nr:ECF transporter S component [Streptococcus macacae]EHJ53047.1 putative membrane protein [Streptococcus macacae NCTC 11558]SUN78490.1 thiamine transporter protein [Streptococcus macacae NCTC 11558]
MKKKRKSSDIAIIAIFFAIMVVIHLLSNMIFNLWPVPIKPTIVHIPVIIASIAYGPRIGATLGGLMGLISLIHNSLILLPTSYLFSPFVEHGNFNSLIIAFVPRILIGVFPYFVYNLLPNRFGLLLAGAVGSAVNTLFVLTGIFVFFSSVYGGNIQAMLAGVISANSIAEMIISAVLTVIIIPRIAIVKK